MQRRPGRTPRAARDGDREPAGRRRADRAIHAHTAGGNSTAIADRHAQSHSNPGALAGLDRHATGDGHRDAATFRYNTFDPTGAAAAPGSYAFLMPGGQATSVVTTYEQLRTAASAMRVNVKDAHGASWGSFYDAVAVGDVVEWRQADDCWARYQVTSAPQAAGGAESREFGVRWVTYAYTGCSGTVARGAAVRFAFEPPNLQSPDITVPVRHGLYLLFPHYWVGELEQTGPLPEQSEGSTYSSDIDVARQHPYWRDPELPAGWGLSSVEVGFEGIDGYVAYYHDSLGGGRGRDPGSKSARSTSSLQDLVCGKPPDL